MENAWREGRGSRAGIIARYTNGSGMYISGYEYTPIPYKTTISAAKVHYLILELLLFLCSRDTFEQSSHIVKKYNLYPQNTTLHCQVSFGVQQQSL